MLPSVEAQIFTETVYFERNDATRDVLGARKASKWDPHGSAYCRTWWWKGSKSSAKSPSEQVARPQDTLSLTGGEMALPLDTDVTEEDRVTRIVNENGETVQGPFRVIAVNPYSDHIEITIERP